MKRNFNASPHVVRCFREEAGWLEKLWGNLVFNFGSLPLLPWHQTLDAKECQRLQAQVQAGDIIIVSDGLRVGSYIIGLNTAHAMLATGEGSAIHAVGDGVVESPLSVVCEEYATYIVVRHGYLPEADAAEVVARARSVLGKPYDFYYDQVNREAFFCTELIEHSFEAVNLPLGLKRTWRKIVLPAAFLKSEQFTEVAHSSNLD